LFSKVLCELLTVELRLFISVKGYVLFIIAYELLSDFNGYKFGTLDVLFRNFSLLSIFIKACEEKFESFEFVTKLFFRTIKGLRVPI